MAERPHIPYIDDEREYAAHFEKLLYKYSVNREMNSSFDDDCYGRPIKFL